jgi:CheY-like chemotaxis protein
MMDRKKVLIIDDEKNIRMTIKNCLDDHLYNIDVAVNGEDGLEKLLNETFDAVLLDIKMPGISGMELLRKIREKQIITDVVMMTAYGTVESAVEAMKLGAIDFLSKPFTPGEIRQVVENVIRRKILKEDQIESFPDILEFSKACIISKDYDRAIQFLKKAISLNVDSPEPHNLLGVIAEGRSDLALARMHYRAALALDPTHNAANRNLERIVSRNFPFADMDLGDEPEPHGHHFGGKHEKK